MKNLQDIIPDREIVKLQNVELLGISYECWRVQPSIFSDQIETLLENGFELFIDSESRVFIHRKLNTSPEQLIENKRFWRALDNLIPQESNCNEEI